MTVNSAARCLFSRKLPRRSAQEVGVVIARKVGQPETTSAFSSAFLSGPAAEHYYAGRFLLNKYSPSALRESVAAFERAIELEPRFGPAYGGKAEALQLLTNFSFVAPAEVMGDAMVAI